jgi:hypothetical protein
MSTAPRLQFDLYSKDQPEQIDYPVEQPQWFAQPPAKKPPRPVGEVRVSWDTARREATVDYATKALDTVYVIEDRPTVLRFIAEHRLHGMLLQAQKPLDEAFTGKTVKKLSLVQDEEGFETLFCLVMISGEMQPARRALRNFDQQWWLTHAKQVLGKLNFDFELI